MVALRSGISLIYRASLANRHYLGVVEIARLGVFTSRISLNINYRKMMNAGRNSPHSGVAAGFWSVFLSKPGNAKLPPPPPYPIFTPFDHSNNRRCRRFVLDV